MGDSDVGIAYCGREWCICGVLGFVEGAGDWLLIQLMSSFGLLEIVPAAAVDAISLANDEDVVVTTGGRRWP